MAITLQRWPIVGRRSELEIFEQALGSAERAGLVIHGRAGVGKTRLADECAAHAAAGGYPTERVAGSRTTALMPLGAVASLLVDGLGQPCVDGQVHTAALFERTRRALLERHEGRRLYVSWGSAAAPTWPGPWGHFMTPEQIALVQSSFNRLGPLKYNLVAETMLDGAAAARPTGS